MWRCGKESSREGCRHSPAGASARGRSRGRASWPALAGLQGAAVGPVQNDGRSYRGQVLQEGCVAEESLRVLCVFFSPDLVGDDLAAEQIEEEVELEEQASGPGGHRGEVSAPELVGSVGCVNGRGRRWRMGFSPALLLVGTVLDAIKGRLGGEVDSPLGQFADDPSRSACPESPLSALGLVLIGCKSSHLQK